MVLLEKKGGVPMGYAIEVAGRVWGRAQWADAIEATGRVQGRAQWAGAIEALTG